MKMEQIIREFERALENEYYMELAKKEVMTVPLLIEVFLDDDYANSLWAEQLLECISGENPKLLYPFFEYIAKGLDSKNSYLAWNTWKILVKLLPVDSDNKFELVKEKFYDALLSHNLPEFSIACDCAVPVFYSKPNEQERILNIMKKSSEKKFYLGNDELKNSGKMAEEKVQIFFERIINDKTKAENNALLI